jgi:hypothetical protein
MEKPFKKFLKRMLSEKYPIYLDVEVNRYHTTFSWGCYEVHLFIFSKDYRKLSRGQIDEVKEYINNLAKYMDIKVCGVYHTIVDEEGWEEMKLFIKD